MLKTRWFIYTVAVGLIPLVARLFVFAVVRQRTIALLLSPVDFSVLGMVVCIANINVLEGRKLADQKWKTAMIGWSVLLIVAYAVLFTLSILREVAPDVFDALPLLVGTIVLSLASVVFGYAVFNHLQTVAGRADE